MEKTKIREHLDKADKDIERGEKLIEEQEERVKELRGDGHEIEIHERSLRNLRSIQESLKKSREIVRNELARE
jgi:peptidoglycan/xylan/chitin deacetylase (PgdA/CDA1 family)